MSEMNQEVCTCEEKLDENGHYILGQVYEGKSFVFRGGSEPKEFVDWLQPIVEQANMKGISNIEEFFKSIGIEVQHEYFDFGNCMGEVCGGWISNPVEEIIAKAEAALK